MKIVKKCVFCDCSFTTYSRPINEKRFCSKSCANSGVKNRISKMGREKIRKRMIKNNPVKRKEVREKISKTLTGRPQPWNRGNKCNLWKGGVSSENDKFKKTIEFKNFIRNVYLRDDYTCRKCGQRGGKLNVHHIKNFSSHKSLRTLITNGITLCLECHRKFHRKYGIKNNTVYQIKEFIKIIL